MAESAGRIGVFLLNMGGPDSPEAVRPFLENLFSDPEILRFPLSRWVRKPMARWIAKRRSLRVAGEYRAMGGKSPLNEITRAQADALAARLGPEYSVHVAMRYWHPRAGEAVAAAKAAGVDRSWCCRSIPSSAAPRPDRAFAISTMLYPRRVWRNFPGRSFAPGKRSPPTSRRWPRACARRRAGRGRRSSSAPTASRSSSSRRATPTSPRWRRRWPR